MHLQHGYNLLGYLVADISAVTGHPIFITYGGGDIFPYWPARLPRQEF